MEKQDQDMLTHPMLYRQNMNSPQQSDGNNNNNGAPSSSSLSSSNEDTKNAKKEQKQGWVPPARPSKDNGDECWDCYPHLVRKIENEGTPEQVEHLHQLEQSHSPKH